MKPFVTIVVLVLVTISAYASEEICNISIEIKTQKLLYENESIDFRFSINNKPSDYKIEYWVEDMFGNIAKNKMNTTNLNKKSFKPEANGVQAFLIKARFSELVCKNTQDEVFENMVLFKGNLDNTNQSCTCVESKKGFYYNIKEIPNIVYSGENFLVNISLDNYDKEKHDIKIWSYVYRGSKVYSESREGNIKQFVIQPNTSLFVELENKAEAEPGEYKLKVKINKDNQKTNKELTENISVVKRQGIISNTQKIGISNLYFTTGSPVKLFAMINNAYKDDLTINIELNSIYTFQKKSVFIESMSDALIDFDVELPEEKNPFFVKIYVNDTLVDIDEIIIENNKVSNKNKENLPFQLVTGDLVFNNSKAVYESSTLKSVRIAVYLFLVLSIVLNCVLLWKKGSMPS